jgi:hypothetical protein
MDKRVVGCSVLALALTGVFASSAAAQNPFLIDGTVTDASNSKASGAATKSTDTHGNSKELGPVQGNNTKFPDIDDAAVPMLDQKTNPNGQTDLFEIWTQTQKDAAGDSWFYFGWSRDSNSGSGFISFEAHQIGNDCDSYSTADLLNCNPFSPRTNGDFAIFWDQSGSSPKVYLRTWNGTSFVPAQPGTDITDVVVNGERIVFAQYSGDLFRGEMALNLTASGLVPPGACKAFPNVIPGTITGNSQGDQADYKDVVLAPISINTCGTVTVTKVTKAPDGSLKADTTTTFTYTLKQGTTTIANAVSIKGCTQTTPNCGGEVDTYTDLNSGSYTLEENSLGGEYVIESIACGTASTNTVGPLSFTLAESATVACTITNKLPLGDSGLVTTPSVRFVLYDQVQVTLDNPLPEGARTVSGVTFALFANSGCTGTPIASRTRSVTFDASGVGTTNILPGASETIPNNDTGVLVSGAGTYYWQVTYPGDSLNKSATLCGEATTVSVQFP